MPRSSLSRRLSNTLVVAAALVWVGYGQEGWILYDEFREIWGALSLLVGDKMPWAGGAAAGLHHASPLTSMLYAGALSIHFHESAPVALEGYIFCAGFLAFYFTTRSTVLRLWLAVAATSAYRLVDIRSGMDQIGMLGVALGIAAVLQHQRWRIRPAWIPWLGLSLGMLPHFHASGLFVAVAITLAYFGTQRQQSWRHNAWLIGFALLPLSYWLIDIPAVDHHDRGWPYVQLIDLPANIVYATLGSFKGDATWLTDIGLPFPWLGYLYRLVVGGFWVASLVYMAARMTHIQRGFVLLFWLVLLARADYMLVTQHLVALAITCILITRPIQAPAWMTVWAFACIVIQIPLTVQLQLRAQDHGFYRVPYQYLLLATPELQTGEGSMFEMPTARYRETRMAENAATHDAPLLHPDTRLTVRDALAFGPTGFLHMDDLSSGAKRSVLTTLAASHPNLQTPLGTTLQWSTLQSIQLGVERLFGANRLARSPTAANSWACVPSEFLMLNQCPSCVHAWLQIPLRSRRGGLIASCTSEPLPTDVVFPSVVYVPY